MFRKYSKKRQPNLQFLNQPLNIIAFIFYLYMQNIEVTYTQANRHTCLKIIRQNGNLFVLRHVWKQSSRMETLFVLREDNQTSLLEPIIGYYCSTLNLRYKKSK